MKKKLPGLILVLAGGILLILSLIADLVPIGVSTGFGRNQVVGAAVGAVLLLSGMSMARNQ